MPDWIVETLEAVPEGLRQAAKQVDGKYVVSVVPTVKLDEFRENNVNLARERDTLKSTVSTFEKLVPDGKKFDEFKAELEALRQMEQEVKDGKLTKSGDVEAEVARRVREMRTDFDRQLQEKAGETNRFRTAAQNAEERLRKQMIDQALMSAVLDEKSGAQPHALQDILTRAHNVFTIENGKVIAKDGEAVIYGADGATPMTPEEWLQGLKPKAAHLFKGSVGGGAGGGAKDGGLAGYSREEFNKLPPMTRLRLQREADKKAGK